MRKILHFVIAGLATLATPLMAQTTPQQEQAIAALMQRYAGDVPGASLLVLKDGKAIVRRSYGQADLEAKIAAAPATNYRLASVSK